MLAGLGLGLSLIVAIGAQNLFVLRQGIRREHVFTVATICALSDLTLISVGVAGLGAATTALPWLIDVVRWVGAAFLIGYGILAARRAWRPAAIGPELADGSTSRASIVLTCLALTWLNPHVYLDTVFLLGSVAATHGDQRWWFALGAMLGSIGWFYGLGYGARLLSRWLTTALGMRLLDGFVAVVMITLGISLIAGS
jgi:Lysine efflux permease